MVQIYGFSTPVRFRGHCEEIGIAKVLLNTKSRRVEKFRDVGFPTSEEVCWCVEREKISTKYNGPRALATLEWATIIKTYRIIMSSFLNSHSKTRWYKCHKKRLSYLPFFYKHGIAPFILVVHSLVCGCSRVKGFLTSIFDCFVLLCCCVRVKDVFRIQTFTQLMSRSQKLFSNIIIIIIFV